MRPYQKCAETISLTTPGFTWTTNLFCEILTKYTAPKLPCPISRRSAKSFSGSSLKKRSAISGSFRLPARLLLGIMGSGGAMPLPPGTIWVCDSDLEAPACGSSAGQGSHMCSELKAEGKARINTLKKHQQQQRASCNVSE